MVTITENALIVKIDCTNETPLEKLAYMQNGLLDLIALVDHQEAPSMELANALSHLRTLLKEMMLDPVQLRAVNNVINSVSELKSVFN